MAISKRQNADGTLSYKAMHWNRSVLIATKSFARKIDAVAWLSHQKANRMDALCGRIKGKRMSLKSFVLDHYLVKATVSEGTLKEYRQTFEKHVFPRFGNWQLSEIYKSDWSEFLGNLMGTQISRARVNRIRSTISAAYRMAISEGYTKDNPINGLPWHRENTSEIKTWNHHEVQTFLSYAECRPLFPMYLMAYETGMRFSELVGLKWDCVDLIERRITVRRAWCTKTKTLSETTKSGHMRTLPMSEYLRQNLMKLRNSSTEFVFQVDSKPISYHSLKSRFKTDQKNASVKLIGFHGFRHTFASHFLMNGGALPELKEILGHADFETTLRYSHLCKDYLLKKASIVSYQPTENSSVLRPFKPFTSHGA